MFSQKCSFYLFAFLPPPNWDLWVAFENLLSLLQTTEVESTAYSRSDRIHRLAQLYTVSWDTLASTQRPRCTSPLPHL